jgi:uncharacterized protein
MNLPIGTLINVAAVVAGSLIGLLFRKALPEKLKLIVFQGIGLVTLVIGMDMALKVDNLLILIFSILIGGIIGEALNLELALESLSEKLKKLVKSKDAKFSEGLITAFD